MASPATPVSSSDLDSLLSPGPEPEHQSFRLSTRDSVATDSEFNDVALDEFSPVALTFGMNPEEPPEQDDVPATRSRSTSDASVVPINADTSAAPQPSHKKSASTATIKSVHNLPFIITRIETQKPDPDTRPNRTSLDGQQKLQEEFARKQSQDDEENVVIDWDFWGAVISDYQQYASDHPEQLARAIAKGIPSTLRGMMWQLMAASKDPELESTYLKLLKESSSHEKAITRDLGRTFPHHDFFTDGQGIGQENLFNVLKAYSIYDEAVGYCQGLPFVVAILLLNMPDEEAFSLLVRLMQVYDLRGHFLPEMPKLQLRLVGFDRLVEEMLPVLHVHFLREGIKSTMFCSQWFLTMFSYRFPLDIVFRIYDNCLASGIEAMFGFGVQLLMKNEDLLLALKFDQILAFLNNQLFDRYKVELVGDGDAGEEEKPQYLVDQFVQDAVSLRITPFMLDAYAREYEDLVRETNKHAMEVDELRNSNRVLSASVKSMEKSLAQLNDEHVHVLNELVKSRLRNEELEGELVRYKLLYAEAMHENQDAQSSQRISFSGFFRKKSACLGVIDYKTTFSRLEKQKDTVGEDERSRAISECHTRSARRVLKALLANGGIFIKLGQHLGSILVLPREWTSTMQPLQDKCEPTPYKDVEALFRSDMGAPVAELFDEFDPVPIGVASLAQVHSGRDRKTGRRVAVKIQHPHLAEFCDIDMAVVESSLGWIKYWFPEFEFSWLAEEMRTNLPLEMNFCHEAANAEKTRQDFRDVRGTTLYIPEVLSATKRVLVMEFIEGGRVDDLVYLAKANINRNQVALEIAAIFNQMVLLNGWFHADPHPGNLLIRSSPNTSRSPYNFEIVLLDHGQYFDLDPELRINYSKLWLSLISPASPSTRIDRRKYAQLVGNIGPELYPVFEAALTGRASMEPSVSSQSETFQRGSGLMDFTPQSEAEKEAIRNAVTQDGVLMSVLDILRRVPRRVLMILKLNDLTRSLDHALMTTHSNVRVFLVSAKYCATAVWYDDRKRLISQMHDRGFLTWGILVQYFRSWWTFQTTYMKMAVFEQILDIQSFTVKSKAWIRGLAAQGLHGAHDAAAGLS
ncbi:ABC1-domain-containing protein [Favolaschia claudopus]|uniref:ABC1-domain-containing protein n=1 Tax=Favolaschia claudopus TaxID=2862362 RepID=A0AAW0DZV6_9AGAR